MVAGGVFVESTVSDGCVVGASGVGVEGVAADGGVVVAPGVVL